MSAGMFAPRVRQYLLLFTVLGEGRARFVHAKWSAAPLSMVKHYGFVPFLLPRPPGDSWVPGVPPGCLLGASWVPPGSLLGASWEPLGGLCLGSHAGVILLYYYITILLYYYINI